MRYVTPVGEVRTHSCNAVIGNNSVDSRDFGALVDDHSLSFANCRSAKNARTTILREIVGGLSQEV